jgi:hypothetical protein
MKIAPRFKGIVYNGAVAFPDTVMQNLYSNWIQGLEGKDISVTVKKYRKDRSDRQNNWYWGVVIQMITDETGYEKDEVHEYLKSLFLTEKRVIVNNEGEVLELEMIKSSARLTTTEFIEYGQKCQRWAAENLNLNIPDPNEAEHIYL